MLRNSRTGAVTYTHALPLPTHTLSTEVNMLIFKVSFKSCRPVFDFMITFFKIPYQERKRKAKPAKALLIKCYLQLPEELSPTRASCILISITSPPLGAEICCLLSTRHCSRRRDGEKLESHKHHSHISPGSNSTRRNLIRYCPKNQRTWFSTVPEIKPPGCRLGSPVLSPSVMESGWWGSLLVLYITISGQHHYHWEPLEHPFWLAGAPMYYHTSASVNLETPHLFFPLKFLLRL